MFNRLYFTIAEVGDLEGDLRVFSYDEGALDWEFVALKDWVCR